MSRDLSMTDPQVELMNIYKLLLKIQQENTKPHQENQALQQPIIQLHEVQSAPPMQAVPVSNPVGYIWDNIYMYYTDKYKYRIILG